MTLFQKTLLGLSLVTFSPLISSAQQSNINAQFSVLPGLSTNGDSAQYYTNNLSFNLFGGLNGGVNGFELGCFANALTGDLYGAQISGITNIVEGEATALQVAGIFNYNKLEFQGFQIGGIANITGQNFTGLQGAGIFNLTDTLIGAQIAGISSQAKMVHGIQVSGIGSVANEVTGIQASGIINNSTSVTGLQAAGLVNHTGLLTGVQLGLINISDSVNGGVPIGLLSFSKNGYKTIDLSINEVFPATLSFKTGVDEFYNILAASSNFDSETHLWSFGYGVGSRFHISKKTLFEFEGIVSHLSRNQFEENVNLLGRFNMNFAVQFGKYGEIYAGPSFNFYATQVYNADTDQYGYSIAPSSVLYEEVIYDFDKPTFLQAWIGFQAGIRL